MSDPRDAVREWVTARARSPEDAKAASTLIAAFVADAVRADRAQRTAKQTQATNALADLYRTLDNTLRGKPR